MWRRSRAAKLSYHLDQFTGSTPAPSKSAKPWNFVVILLDDAGWRDFGFTENRYIETPNLDRLAERGMTFANAYATHPFCSPTRQSMITGQWPARTAWVQKAKSARSTAR
jgi:arylsulfatase A-like enzyme